MSYVTQWTVDISLFEEDDATAADAVLHTRDTEPLRGHGVARRNPVDPSVPEIGDESAAARGLVRSGAPADRDRAANIEAVTGRRADVQT